MMWNRSNISEWQVQRYCSSYWGLLSRIASEGNTKFQFKVSKTKVICSPADPVLRIAASLHVVSMKTPPPTTITIIPFDLGRRLQGLCYLQPEKKQVKSTSSHLPFAGILALPEDLVVPSIHSGSIRTSPSVSLHACKGRKGAKHLGSHPGGQKSGWRPHSSPASQVAHFADEEVKAPNGRRFVWGPTRKGSDASFPFQVWLEVRLLPCILSMKQERILHHVWCFRSSMWFHLENLNPVTL